MEGGDASRYLGVFLSGGVSGGLAKTLLDHWLADRRERRAGLRPKDRERIEAIRTFVDIDVDQVFNDVLRGLDLSKDSGQSWPDAVKAANELDDRRLTRAWKHFTETVPKLRGFLVSHPPEKLPEHIVVIDPKLARHERRLERDRRRLVRQLNRLERSR